jgi:hypothetical protein
VRTRKSSIRSWPFLPVLSASMLSIACTRPPASTEVRVADALVVGAAGRPAANVQPSDVAKTELSSRCRLPPPPPSGQGDDERPPGFERSKLAIAKEFDRNGDGRLDRAERDRAREFVKSEQSAARANRPPMGPPPDANGMPMGPFADRAPPVAGPRISSREIKRLAKNVPLYAPATMRTLVLEFKESDWESELASFYDTDVEVPAALTVDGVKYKDVGVRFRGMSSFSMVPAGFKRSLNLSIDAWTKDQNLFDYRSLNLLNSAHDATFMRSVLALEIARHYVPAPKANHVRVVINGESWGVYVNAQQFNREFIRDWFGTTEGRLWKVPGSPGGRGSLQYLGEDPKAYRGIYQLKGKDDPEAFRDLIRLCRVLNQTKPEALERELAPLLDIDGALRFLALENLLVNSDGYFVRTSDYNLYQGRDGRFVIIPHDVNETFNALDAGPPEAAGQHGVEVEPLVAASDPSKPLISRLLAVPSLRIRYLSYLREMASTWLDWARLSPIIESHQNAISREVERDTRNLGSLADFRRGVTENTARTGPCGDEIDFGLKPFVEARRAFLLNHPALKTLVDVGRQSSN